MNMLNVHTERRGTHAVKWQIGEEDIIPMCIADMDFRIAEPIIQAVSAKAAHGIYGYSIACEEYEDAICGWWNHQYGWKINKEWLCFSPGVVPGLHMLLQVLTKPGDRVIVQTPVYPPFFDVITHNGCEIAANPLRQGVNGYEMDYDDLERQAAHPLTKAIILCSPHNPVGRVWTREELTRVADICMRHGVTILSDEIHGDLTLFGHRLIPFASLSDQIAEHSVVLSAPSKTFNIAGLQTSVVFIPNESLRAAYRDTLNRIGLMRPNAFGVEATKAAYRDGREWLNEALTYIENNMTFALDYLKQHMPEIRCVQPEATHLLWMDCRDLGMTSDELCHYFLHEAKVRLGNGQTYGQGGEGFLRMNVACPREALSEALTRIERALRQLRLESKQ
ncbi:MalY/PatB family protein [Paenibacillus marinisediminis]